ncbi:MAG: hypothetical protein A2V69_03350 [Candidatus Portnoybacteria bacterium RBG_13_40_8]|uniref:ComEC/Rec2-related protein domain-containing protein n=1 Tax=Candidatus Portnoybacteria bacterium RBG_13_40_8 TaxID=1801990 RepID=A0A1G2F5R1_9BACT|nr:MAG: hypothetical protein A2V69_03350 [Candidatus Portnoybacteria bacterium RBG_13_40_8]OGZ35551.1 MAG: hypothetical protein A2V60_02530 [Candidatus Portnoybacteria bacterium RIFCSPHIGHO2_01_FULL_39_19]
MKISNIFLIICLIFIVMVFFVSPKIIERKIPKSLPEEGIIIGKTIKDPDLRSDNTKLTIQIDKGKILVTTSSYPEYFYGDVLKIEGKIQIPQEFEGFNYKNYLAKDGIYYVMYWPKIEIMEKNKGNPIFSTILKFKNNLTGRIEKIMPFPEISILEGLILGNKQIFSEKIKNDLSITGTSHITAISGMNIVIISNILMFVLIGLGMWRKQAFWFVLVLIFLFILMVGAPASAVRAGIMGAILLYAQKIGRLSNAARIMVFAATIMLIFNPLLLRYDIGFQLSFLAVLGLIYIKPIFDEWLKKFQKREQISFLLEIITTTVAAQIAVLPVLVYNFGKISFISPLTNVLIVPLIPFITAIGLVFIGSTLIWSFLGKILLWPAYLGSTYILRIIDWFAKIPWAAKQIPNLHWIWLMGYYVLLIFGIWFYMKKTKLRY